MIYQIDFLIETAEATVSVVDLTQVVKTQLSDKFTQLSMKIELPTDIKISIEKTSEQGMASIKEVRLGHIKFNKDQLSRLFVYSTSYGQCRDTVWLYNGLVTFSFFEFSAIKYHLLMNSKI
jgi:hypothetical protein